MDSTVKVSNRSVFCPIYIFLNKTKRLMSKGNITKVTNGKGILVCNYISLQVMSSYKSCKLWTDEKKRTGKDLKTL